MTVDTLTGYADDLRALSPGGSVVRHARVPLDQRDRLDAFRRAITAANAKADGSFRTQSLDGVTDDFSHAVRAVITTRIN